MDMQDDIIYPEEVNGRWPSYDQRRYSRESVDPLLVKGMELYNMQRYDEAGELLESAYQRNGNVLAGVLRGCCYYRNKEYDRAIPYLVSGVYRGCSLGAAWLAECYRMGHGVLKDVERAKRIYRVCEHDLETMCNMGSAYAQYFYGYDLVYGDLVEADEAKGMRLLEQAMNGGYQPAGVEVARGYLKGRGVAKDEAKGAQILLGYEDSRLTNANYELGKLYYYGTGVAENYHKALEHFLRAAEHSHKWSQSYLGDIYYWGHDVSGDEIAVDYAQARKWYELAAAQDEISSIRMLGLLYYYGHGVDEDRDQAFAYFKKAADRDDRISAYMLRHYYLEDGKYKDAALGIKYLTRAADAGDDDALYELGLEYVRGVNVTKDLYMGYDYLCRAAAAGNADADRLVTLVNQA